MLHNRETASTTPSLGRAAMRIAMIAPPWFEIPPRAYGGTEAVVGNLVDALVGRGHHVTLVASGARGTAAQEFRQVYEVPPSQLLGDPLPEVTSAVEAERFVRDLKVDVIHDHSLAGPLHAPYRNAPTVVTVHGPADGINGEYFARLGSDVSAVAISRAQRRRNPAINWVATVHNAIDVSSYTATANKDDFVLWLGRFCADKAPQMAIDAARSRGKRIVLAGKRSEPAEQEFFDREVVPRLGRGVEYVGEADAELKRELLSKASALVFPIQWDEPFGIVMAEALASGTPVVAFNRGSVPEVVKHGRTGFIASDMDGFCHGIDAVAELDPAECRADAEERFDLPVMADGYLRAFAGVMTSRALTNRAPKARVDIARTWDEARAG